MLIKIPRAWLIFLILFLVFFLSASGNIDSIDANTHIFLARKILNQGRIYFERQENDILHMPVALNSKDGNYYPFYNPGYAFLQMPGIIASQTIRRILDVKVPDFPIQPDWIITAYANILNGIAVALIGMLIYRLSIEFKPELESDNKLPFIIILLILSTNLFVEGHSHFVHPFFTLFLLSCFWQLHGYLKHKQPKYLVLFSLFFLFVGSLYNVTFVLLIPSFLAYTLAYCPLKAFVHKGRERRTCLGTTALIMAATLPAFFLQLTWNYLRFGNVLSMGYFDVGMKLYDFSLPVMAKNAFGLLFSLNKGFFIHNVVLVFAVVFVLRDLIRNKGEKRLNWFISALFLAYLAGYIPYTYWHGDEAYGPRFLTPLIPWGILVIILNIRSFGTTLGKVVLGTAITAGVFIQIPGILIPNFSIIYLAPSNCPQYDRRYFDWRCSSVKVGWSHLIRRRIKETLIVTASNKNTKNAIALAYPNPPKPFRTIYPDPLFDRLSPYKTASYTPDKKMAGDIYSFVIDIWWIKNRLYKNIPNI